MSIGSVIAIIGGIVTAGCAIAGAIAGIRARKAEERRAEEMRRAEHGERLRALRERRESRMMGMNNMNSSYTMQPVQMPATNEVHYYYHNIPQQPVGCSGYGQSQNNYMNQGYVNSGYSYGNQYNDSVYRGEREIGNRSKMQLMQRFFPQQYQQTGYYPHQQYAYAV